MSSQNEPDEELLLFARAGRGIATAVAVFTVLGFVLITMGDPAMALHARLGIGLFVGAWSGPFFGIAGAIGYHQIQNEQRAEPALVAQIPETEPPIDRAHRQAA